MHFLKYACAHRDRYPAMSALDFGKLAYQSEYGPRHFALDEAAALAGIRAEWQALPAGEKAAYKTEGICDDLRRFYLSGPYDEDAARLLAVLFVRTAQEHMGTDAGLQEKLQALRTLGIPGWDAWMADYRAAGCPAVSHSAAYRQAYAPHYRLLKAEYAHWFPVLLRIWQVVQRGPAVISIDGRCGSGKTTLAALAQRLFGGNVLHMDDFYLPGALRSPDWDERPAGNMDLERFLDECLRPAAGGQPIVYRPYSCGTGDYLPETLLQPAPLTIVEGSYSQHPMLLPFYTLRIYLTADPVTQTDRLKKREGRYYPVFVQQWIPMEERYQAAFAVMDHADMVFDASDEIL